MAGWKAGSRLMRATRPPEDGGPNQMRFKAPRITTAPHVSIARIRAAWMLLLNSVVTFRSAAGMASWARMPRTWPWIMNTPALVVVITTTVMGTSVTHRYFARPSFTSHAETTASAMTASNWLEMPNTVQMTANESLFMNHAQPTTTSSVVRIELIQEFVLPSGA